MDGTTKPLETPPATRQAKPMHEWEDVTVKERVSMGPLFRAKVPGGWLYRNADFPGAPLVFVPRPRGAL